MFYRVISNNPLTLVLGRCCHLGSDSELVTIIIFIFAVVIFVAGQAYRFLIMC